MNSPPAVSIYMITYLNSAERGKVLERSCAWALEQRYPNFEVVVSDNGGSYSAVEALAAINDSRLKICTNTSNEGFTGNLNRCLKHCTHDIIKPICDDDLIHLDFLTTMVPLVDDESLLIADVEKFLFNRDPEDIREGYGKVASVETRKAGYASDIWSLPYSDSCIPSAILFTRRFFKELGGFDNGTRISDWDFFLEACLRRQIVHVKRRLCYVGVWEESLTEVMKEDPYFYAREGLYTHFRIMRTKHLSWMARFGIFMRLWRKFAWQSMRLVKHPLSSAYLVGYKVYFKRFFELLKSGITPFAFERQCR